MSWREALGGAGEPRRPRIRPFAVVLGVFVTAIVIVGDVLKFSGSHSSHIPLFALVVIAIATPFIVLAFLAGSGFLYDAEDRMVPGRPTGRFVLMRDPNVWTASPTVTGGWRWIGGASVPLRFWRLDASWGLAVLDLDQQGLTLRVRLGVLFGLRPLVLTPSDAPVCYPIRNVVRRRGVAIQQPGERAWYFWSGAVSEILTTLAWAGYQVQWEERRPRLW